MDYRIKLYDSEDNDIFSAVQKGLRAYNRASFPQWFNDDSEEPPLYAIAHDHAGQIIAGLVGKTYWGCLFINYLWVSDSLRGTGLGKMLLRQAEAEAQKRGCTFGWLTTFDFQAPRFYEKHGYRVVGQMDNFPPGHTLYTLRKDF